MLLIIGCISTMFWLQLEKAVVVPMVNIAMGRHNTYLLPTLKWAYVTL